MLLGPQLYLMLALALSGPATYGVMWVKREWAVSSAIKHARAERDAWWRAEIIAKSGKVRDAIAVAGSTIATIDTDIIHTLGETDAALEFAERRLGEIFSPAVDPPPRVFPGMVVAPAVDACPRIPARCLR